MLAKRPPTVSEDVVVWKDPYERVPSFRYPDLDLFCTYQVQLNGSHASA